VLYEEGTFFFASFFVCEKKRKKGRRRNFCWQDLVFLELFYRQFWGRLKADDLGNLIM
jgi:hypothetical protein